MARYIDLDKAIERLNVSPAFPNMGMDGYFLLGIVEDLLNNIPPADVAPKEKIIQEVVSDIKKLIHSHARYPRSVEIDNYITLKVVDAILNDYLKKYSKQERT
jgi:hypothetical protein